MKKYLLLLIIALSMTSLRASHFMGGEITWECLPNGNYRFTLVVYRECAGITYPNTVTLTSNSPAGYIQLYLWPNPIEARKDISPVCNDDSSLVHIDCPSIDNTPGSPSNTGAVEQWTYTSDSIYPNGVMLNGIPEANGWYFAYTSCCRNPCSNIPGNSSNSWFLRATMYAFQNQNAYPCLDNSPQFLESPSTAICMGYPFNFSHKAYDKDGDSLAFSWAQPLGSSTNAPIQNFNPGYFYYHPFPGFLHNPNNVPAQIDPTTGDIQLTSFTQGAFTFAINVSSYRSGAKIAEVFREMQVTMLPCGNNLPPVFITQNLNPSGDYLYTDTVYSGDTLRVPMQLIDTFPLFLPNGDMTAVHLTASSPQFGAAYTSDSSGCLTPPCATLSPPAPLNGIQFLITELEWAVTDDHFYNPAFQSQVSEPYYDFYFSAKDDYCPIPASNNFTYRVYVRPGSFKTTSWHCREVNQQGDISLRWNKPIDPNGAFLRYVVHYKAMDASPWVIKDTLLNIQDTSYFDNAALIQNQLSRYQVFVHYTAANGLTYERRIFEETIPGLFTSSKVCEGNYFYLNAQGVDASGAVLNWDFGGITFISGNGSGPYTLQADTPGLHTIRLNVITACGISHITKDIEIRPKPDVHISGPRYYCPGSTLTLTASGGMMYEWSNGANSPQIQLSSIYPPVTYTVTVTDTNLCMTSSSVDIRNVRTFNNPEICLVSAIQGTPYQKVLWNNPDEKDIRFYRVYQRNAATPGLWTVLEEVPYHLAGSLTDSLHNPGQAQYHYAIQVVDSCDDESAISAPQGTMRLQAYNAGNGDIIISWLPYYGIAPGHFVHLYRYAPSVGSFVFVDSVQSSLITYTDHNPPQELLQYYAVVKEMQCFDPAGNLWTEALSNTVSVDNTTGLDAPSPEDALRVFTVPSQPYIFIERAGPGLRAAYVLLFDVLGRQVMDIRLDAGVQQKLVPSSALVKGVYYYLVRHTEGTQQGGKLVVGR